VIGMYLFVIPAKAGSQGGAAELAAGFLPARE